MKKIVIVRGAGDLATGIIIKLHNCGYKVIALEIEKPTSIRRLVSFSEAIYKKSVKVENVECKYFQNISDALKFEGVSVVVDEKCDILNEIKPFCVIDSILAKKNMGTKIDMAEIVIGVGPGFTAGQDCHAVVETKRGHSLGKIYYSGYAIENTGVPGEIMGYSSERVIHANNAGEFQIIKEITSIVKKGDVIAKINGNNVYATIDGILRGIISDKVPIKKGMKIADIDPRRLELNNCSTISEKARCVAGGVLEAVLYLDRVKKYD